MMNGVDGINQGGEGLAQGGIGSFVGKATGSLTGMNRAATGGPNMNQAVSQPTAASPTGGATEANSLRKPMGFLDFLGGIASTAASFIPGVGGIVAGGLGKLISGVSQSNAQNAAANAAQAGTNAQNSLAGSLASGSALAPLIKQEQAGITSAVDNSNAANPGKLMMDLFGGAISNAISGVAQTRQAGQVDAAGIYQNTTNRAQTAATAGGNAWQPLANWGASLKPKTPATPGTTTATGAGSPQSTSDGQDNGGITVPNSAFASIGGNATPSGN